MTTILEEIREELYRLQDIQYRDFQSKLIPGSDPATFIGVRTPQLRKLAKQLAGRNDINAFLSVLPHAFFDEDQLHAFIISEIKDYDKCLAEVERFLPYVNNWATCDQLSPKVFRKHRQELLAPIRRWIFSGSEKACRQECSGDMEKAGHCAANDTGGLEDTPVISVSDGRSEHDIRDAAYTIRFGIGMLMTHYLDEDFDPAYPEMVAAVKSEEYYVRMMAAWYFATALAKQYETVLPYLENHRLDPWTHNKTIRKAIESYRITPEQKEYLRGLKV